MSDVSSGDLKAELRTLILNEWGIIGGFIRGGHSLKES